MKSTPLNWLSYSVFAFFISISILPGCKKSSSGSSTAVTATINGSSFQATNTTGIDIRSSNELSISGYFISGTDTADLGIAFSDTARVNTVQNNANGSFFEIYYLPHLSNSTTYLSGDISGPNGTVTITSIDTVGHKVTGTFSGVAQLVNGTSALDSVTITNGHFSSSYTIQ